MAASFPFRAKSKRIISITLGPGERERLPTEKTREAAEFLIVLQRAAQMEYNNNELGSRKRGVRAAKNEDVTRINAKMAKFLKRAKQSKAKQRVANGTVSRGV